MAITIIDGFDLYNGVGANTGLEAKWGPSPSTAVVLAAGRFGGQCVQSGGTASSTSHISRGIPATANISIGFAWRATTMVLNGAANLVILGLLNSGTTQVAVKLNSNGGLEALRWTGATFSATVLGASAPGVIQSNTWHYIEVEITISDSVGVFKIYVDGVNVLSLTGQDTRNGAPTTVDTIQIGKQNGSTDTGIHQWDDFYATDTATKLGERRVETLYATGDVTGATDWTPSTGVNHYAVVDETLVNGDTDYIAASTVGNTDRFTHGALSSSPASISAVQVSAFSKKTDATSRSIALQVKSGATTSDGANFALAVGYGKQERILETDPNTAAAWTAANVNSSEFGVKVTV